MKIILLACLILFFSCSSQKKQNDTIKPTINFRPVLDSIWQMEQNPITLRDSYIDQFGVDSKQAKEQHAIYKQNHIINEIKIRNILDTYGWPTKDQIGENGNRTICNVIQHSNNEIRLKYLPLMIQAVKDNKLEAALLVRAKDRIATESGDLQMYGGQMKYYPETKSFNVWPVYDPANIDKRRAEIGLEPIASFLKRRFNFVWNLEEQLIRTEEFKKKMK